MKIISLNTFSGVVHAPLMAFVARTAPDTDVFCFQEVMSAETLPKRGEHKKSQANLLQQLVAALPEFRAWYAPVQDDIDKVPSDEGHWQYGLALFVRKSHDVVEQGDFFIHNGFNSFDGKNYGSVGSNAQFVRVRTADGMITICNVHGTSEPGDKLDTPERLAQTRRLLEFLGHPERTVVVGDFNLLPDTQSIRAFTEAGFRNLISDFRITTTRGSLMKTLYPHYGTGPHGFQEFADYAFVSPDTEVRSFFVPDEPISDHLPLILEIA